MLALDSPRWAELRDAYGSASDIPGLLEEAAELPTRCSTNDEPYFSLWSALCHQGDIYTASYAALPHLVEILRVNPDCSETTLVHLTSRIEIARLQGRGPSMPEDLSAPYFAALAKLPEVVGSLLASPRRWDDCRVILSALATARGHARLAEAIEELSTEVAESLMERWIHE